MICVSILVSHVIAIHGMVYGFVIFFGMHVHGQCSACALRFPEECHCRCQWCRRCHCRCHLTFALPYTLLLVPPHLTLSHPTLPTSRCRLVTCWLDNSLILFPFRREEARRQTSFIFLYNWVPRHHDAERKARGVSHGTALSE